jgi:hypothetical protein
MKEANSLDVTCHFRLGKAPNQSQHAKTYKVELLFSMPKATNLSQQLMSYPRGLFILLMEVTKVSVNTLFIVKMEENCRKREWWTTGGRGTIPLRLFSSLLFASLLFLWVFIFFHGF